MRTFNKRRLAVSVAILLMGGCAPTVTKEEGARAVEGYVVDANKLFVVDCLLPGQVRKLGTQMTYLSARRPIRTTEADCEVRGGEYVAYDRANYASALNVWLDKAKDGDPTAQLYVGQIYEKGLGQPPDYAKAAEWYRKAATQGSSQAQINLGHLYEKGLGVPKDPAAAIEWYGKAAGLENAGLTYSAAASSTKSLVQPPITTEKQAGQQPQNQSQREIDELRAQLKASQHQVVEQQTLLRKSQEDLEALRAKVSAERSSTPNGDSGVVRELEAELRRKESLLKAQQARVSNMSNELQAERRKMQRELDSTRERMHAQASNENELAEAKRRFSEAETALGTKTDEYEKKSAELTGWLTGQSGSADDAGLRPRIDLRKKELQSQAAEISAAREQLDQLGRKVHELEKMVPDQVAQNGPNIDIIQPPVRLTRGLPIIQVSEDIKEIVGKVDTAVGLQSLNVNDKIFRVDASGLFHVPLDLHGDTTLLKIAAVDRKNRRTEISFNIMAERSATTVAASQATATRRSSERFANLDFGKFYALIIGNQDYSAFPDLKTPINDARSVDVLLRERYGFTTKVLLNANRHAVMTAFNEIQSKLAENDNLLIYYAGHGEIDPSTKNAYWLPTDAEIGNTANWISSKSITDLLSIMPARHILVVADSCYSGAMAGSAIAKLPDGIDENKRERWLKVMMGKKARTVFTSGDVRPVLDEGSDGHSIFATAFLQALRSNKGLLEDYEIFRAVANQVSISAARVGFKQTPSYAPLQYAGHEGSPFFFLPET